MDKNKDLLEEYTEVTKEIENIMVQLNTLKNVTGEKYKSAQSEDEKSTIFIDFKTKVDKFKQGPKQKYKKLIKRKEQLELEIRKLVNKNENDIITINSDDSNTNNNIVYIDEDTDEIMEDINTLITKYKKFIHIPIENKNYIGDKKNEYVNEKTMKTQDSKQIKKLFNLMESLKMDASL